MPTGCSVMVKMHEPKDRVPLEVVVPDVMVKGTAVVPAAGAEKVKVWQRWFPAPRLLRGK